MRPRPQSARQHVADIEAVAELPWLVDGLWPAEGVGFLGGHPKTGKSRLALRGSGDFWAWSDTNRFLARRKHGLELAHEHRSSAAPEPMRLKLVTETESGPFLR